MTKTNSLFRVWEFECIPILTNFKLNIMTSVQKFLQDYENCNICYVDGQEVLSLNTSNWTMSFGFTFRNCIIIKGRKNIIAKIKTFKEIRMITWNW